MKILHTADWHLGKVLHKYPLREEIKLFFGWLKQTIQQEQVDVLLISGDIFDIGNPSALDRQVYFEFLKALNVLQIQVIITGGNHDSVGLLNAPQEVLELLNIHVIGGATEDLKDELIEIQNQEGAVELVIAAVPFLRDKDLRNQETDQLYPNRTEAIREGIKNHYQAVYELAKQSYPHTPLLAMGHLYAVGAALSDSERDIHVGNAAAIDSHMFPPFEYIALGHIHRPQIIGGNAMIRYSGSPIALSFSEKRDQKSVILLDVQEGQIQEPQVLPVPKFRELKRFSGSMEEVKEKLQAYTPAYPLTSFVELEVKEANFSAIKLKEVEDLKAQYDTEGSFTILKSKVTFETGVKDTAALFQGGENIEDLKPMDVFDKKLESEDTTEEQKSLLKDAFQELLDLLQEEDTQ